MEQVKAARDGMEVYVSGTLPRGRNSKSKMRFTPSDIKMVAGKLDGMLRRTYLEEVSLRVRFISLVCGRERMTFVSCLMALQVV